MALIRRECRFSRSMPAVNGGAVKGGWIKKLEKTLFIYFVQVDLCEVNRYNQAINRPKNSE